MKNTTKKLQLLFLLPFVFTSGHSTEQLKLNNAPLQHVPKKVKKEAKGFMQWAFGKESLKTRAAFVKGREEIKKRVLKALNTDILESIDSAEEEYKKKFVELRINDFKKEFEEGKNQEDLNKTLKELKNISKNKRKGAKNKMVSAISKSLCKNVAEEYQSFLNGFVKDAENYVKSKKEEGFWKKGRSAFLGKSIFFNSNGEVDTLKTYAYKQSYDKAGWGWSIAVKGGKALDIIANIGRGAGEVCINVPKWVLSETYNWVSGWFGDALGTMSTEPLINMDYGDHVSMEIVKQENWFDKACKGVFQTAAFAGCLAIGYGIIKGLLPTITSGVMNSLVKKSTSTLNSIVEKVTKSAPPSAITSFLSGLATLIGMSAVSFGVGKLTHYGLGDAGAGIESPNLRLGISIFAGLLAFAIQAALLRKFSKKRYDQAKGVLLLLGAWTGCLAVTLSPLGVGCGAFYLCEVHIGLPVFASAMIGLTSSGLTTLAVFFSMYFLEPKIKKWAKRKLSWGKWLQATLVPDFGRSLKQAKKRKKIILISTLTCSVIGAIMMLIKLFSAAKNGDENNDILNLNVNSILDDYLSGEDDPLNTGDLLNE